MMSSIMHKRLKKIRKLEDKKNQIKEEKIEKQKMIEVIGKMWHVKEAIEDIITIRHEKKIFQKAIKLKKLEENNKEKKILYEKQ